MAQSHRWTLKVLSFPVFHDAFAKAILASPLADPAFVIALDADSAPDFLCKMSGLGEALDPSVFDVLMGNSFLMEQFWTLIISSEKAFLSSNCHPARIWTVSEQCESGCRFSDRQVEERGCDQGTGVQTNGRMQEAQG